MSVPLPTSDKIKLIDLRITKQLEIIILKRSGNRTSKMRLKDSTPSGSFENFHLCSTNI